MFYLRSYERSSFSGVNQFIVNAKKFVSTIQNVSAKLYFACSTAACDEFLGAVRYRHGELRQLIKSFNATNCPLFRSR